MVDARLIRYVQTELKKGYSREALRSTLLRYGYPPEDVNEAFRQAGPPRAKLFLFIVLIAFAVGASATLFFLFYSNKAEIEQSVVVKSVQISIPTSDSPNFRSIGEEPTSAPESVSYEVAAHEEVPEAALATTSKDTSEDQAIKDIVVLAGEDSTKARDLCIELILRDQCLLEAGLTVHDQLFCAVIKNDDKRDTCYFNLALVAQDNLLCRDITDQHLKSTCTQI